MAFWYSLWSFGTFFTFWYVWTKKDLATLRVTRDGFLKNGVERTLGRSIIENVLKYCANELA
jgi:hypothetical protein